MSSQPRQAIRRVEIRSTLLTSLRWEARAVRRGACPHAAGVVTVLFGVTSPASAVQEFGFRLLLKEEATGKKWTRLSREDVVTWAEEEEPAGRHPD